MTKAALRRLALEVRAEVGVGVHGPLDPYRLAQQYGLQVHRLSDLDCTEAAGHFGLVSPAAFSGALVPFGHGAVIVDNDSHDWLRRRSTTAHEVAHWVLEHPFTAPLMTSGHQCRIADPEREREAAELGGELLVPAGHAQQLAYRNATDSEVAAVFEVSVEMARWRMDGTGARTIARRAARKRAAAKA